MTSCARGFVVLFSLKAKFSKPSDGWITFDLATSEAAHCFRVSYVPNDFLSELLSALILVVNGVEGKALANLEPTLVEFNFAPTEHGEVVFRVVENGDQKTVSQILLVHSGTMASVVLPLWRAVRKLQSEISLEEYRVAMRREFPVEKLNKLSELLKKE